jgi:alanine-alpha-ketoisovalerate/valine-pyruvate aminotransferase
MIEYERDNSLTKDASSISEKNVTISYDTSQGKGVRIQSMIQDLRNKYSCVVDMI